MSSVRRLELGEEKRTIYNNLLILIIINMLIFGVCMVAVVTIIVIVIADKFDLQIFIFQKIQIFFTNSIN